MNKEPEDWFERFIMNLTAILLPSIAILAVLIFIIQSFKAAL